MNASHIESWLTPLTMPEFRTTYWTRQPFYSAANHERIASTAAILGGLELESLLPQAIGDVRVWFENGGVPDYSMKLPPTTAAKLYRAGLTLYFDLQNRELASNFATKLDQPDHRAIASVFASRAGKRTLAHIDGNDNFTLQLSGSKIWRFRFDPSCVQVLESNTAVPPASNWQSVELNVGDVLYMPAGWVHETETVEDATSLNLAIRCMNWADLITQRLRTKLLRIAEWRTPLRNDITGKAQLDKLLAQVSMTDLSIPLNNEIKALSQLQRNPNAVVFIEHQPAPTEQSPRPRPIATIEVGSDRHTLELDASLETLLRWICEQPTCFKTSDAIAFSPKLDDALLMELIEIGLLENAAEH